MDSSKQELSIAQEVSATQEKVGEEWVENGSESFSPLEISTNRKLLRKLDAVILPLLSLAYLLAYMDRNNIGNARIMGLETNLHLSAQQYYNSVMIFYAGYLVTIFPGNLLIRIVGPNFQLGFAVLAFGLFVSCMSAARGYADLIGFRFGIGGAEALLQSGTLYLSVWYGRHELGKRIAFFYSAATLSGVFSGLIAYGVQKDLSKPGERPSWQWLFIIEGVIAIALGLCIMGLLPGFPDQIEKCWLLTKEDVQFAVRRSRAMNEAGAEFKLWQVKASLLDPKTYMLAILSGTNSTLLASVGAFLPTIVKSFGFSSLQTQLFTTIPYVCAFFSMIIIATLSDHCRNKSLFILGSLSCCAVGLVILITTTTRESGMVGVCFLVLGAYPAAVLQMAWTQITFCGYTKRAVSWGVAMIFGQGFSMLGAQIYTNPPRFFKGHGTLLGLVLVGIIVTVVAHLTMARLNRKRDLELAGFEASGDVHPDAGKSFEETCDSNVNYRYIL